MLAFVRIIIFRDTYVITVNGGRHAVPNTLTVVTALDKRLAARKRVGHGLAPSRVKDSLVSTLTTCHWLIVVVLGQRISKSITDENRLEVDIGFRVGQDFGSEYGDVVASI